MALVVRNRVQETGTANTTVSFTLNGAVTGFQSFASIGNNNTTYYTATDASGSWEVGLGTYSTSGPTLTRNTILASSNTGSAVTFSGDVNVFVTYPSDTAVYSNGTNLVGPTNIPLQVSNGGTGVIASSGANSVVLRDVNGNISGVNNVEVGLTLVTSAGGITTLTAASTQIQILTGSANQTFKLPDATTLLVGTFYTLSNSSTGVLTVTDNADAVIETIPQGGAAQVLCVSIATVAGTWGFRVFAASNVTWGNANLDYNGTITSAEWQGDTVQPAYGGTGLTTFTGANNALYSTGASTLTAGTLPIIAGGTGATTDSGARTALGATTLGSNIFTVTNPSAITFPRFNADNTVSSLDAPTFRTAIGAGTSSTTGTVTSVGGTGTVNGISLSGTVTSSGNLTLGGTLSGVSLTTQVSGTLPIANGGTGATTDSGARTALGLGTIATQAASNVAITGGLIETTKLQSYRETVSILGTISGATQNLDLSTSNIFDVTLGNDVTFTFTNPPSSGTAINVTVIVRQPAASAGKLATFTNAKYTDGTAPILSTGVNEIDVLTFFTINGGTFWFGTFAMANVS
jgi:hypothetical protein